MQVFLQQVRTWEFWAVMALVIFLIGAISMLFNSSYLAQHIDRRIDAISAEVRDNKVLLEKLQDRQDGLMKLHEKIDEHHH